MRILLCSFDFPPIKSPQALRWFYLTRELSRLGHQVDVITIRLPEGYGDPLEHIPEGISVYRTFPGPLYYLAAPYTLSSSGSKLLQSNPEKRPFFLRGRRRLYELMNAVFFPDIRGEWIPFAYWWGANLLRRNRYDILLTSSEPRTSHLIGYLLKKRSGIPWLGDYGDPWIYHIPYQPEPRLKRKFLRQAETRILRRLDAITVATEGIKRQYLDEYPFLNGSKVYVVRQGFDQELLDGLEGEKTSPFRIVYCGSFHPTLRDPSIFFEAMREVVASDIEVLIAGRPSRFVEAVNGRFETNKVRYVGFLDHKEALRLEKSATILLHFGNASAIQIPGKIYEYLGAGKPILCIRGCEEDPIAQMVTSHGFGIAVDNNLQEIKEAVLSLYDSWKNGTLETAFTLGYRDEYTWRRSAELLLQAVATARSAANSRA